MVQPQHCMSNVVQLLHCGIAQEQSRIPGYTFFQSSSMPPKLPLKLPPKIRKFESGAEKRRKKKNIAELIESQTVALDKFVVKETQIPIDDNAIPIDDNVDAIPIDVVPVDNVDAIPIDDNVDVENLDDNEDDNQNVETPFLNYE